MRSQVIGNVATILEGENMEINGLCYFKIIIYEGDLAANGDYFDIRGDRETTLFSGLQEVTEGNNSSYNHKPSTNILHSWENVEH